MSSQQMQGLISIMSKMMEQGGMARFSGQIDPVRLRTTIETAQKGMPLEPGVSYHADELGGVEAECCMPENAREDAVILYIHGGGLVCGNAFTSRGFGGMLAGETKIPVYTISYRLAPEHTYPAGSDDCMEAYMALKERYSDIPVFLIGESGGAYYSLITSIQARDKGVEQPAGMILYSPVGSFDQNMDRSGYGKNDITISEDGLAELRRMYCPDPEQWEDPYVSPLNADFEGLCPAYIVWDEDELLAADGEQILAKLRESGSDVMSDSYPECFHAFATTGRGTPESAEVLAKTVGFIEGKIPVRSFAE